MNDVSFLAIICFRLQNLKIIEENANTKECVNVETNLQEKLPAN